MSETIAITGKSVKLFKGHYTRALGQPPQRAARARARRIVFRRAQRNAGSGAAPESHANQRAAESTPEHLEHH
ncbi:MAG: hypothetical protein ACREYE_09330 [Gammaproteobacteria bacterium]